MTHVAGGGGHLVCVIMMHCIRKSICDSRHMSLTCISWTTNFQCLIPRMDSQRNYEGLWPDHQFLWRGLFETHSWHFLSSAELHMVIEVDYPFYMQWSILESLGLPNFPLSVLWVKKVCNITRNELANNFIEFLKTFQNANFTWHLLLSPSLETRCVNFTTFLPARCIIQNDFKNFP